MKIKNLRKIRHKRLRRKVQGTEKRPRLSVFRSSKHMYAQIINDQEQKTLVSVSTLDTDFDSAKVKPTTQDAAFSLGQLIAKKAKDAGIKEICFDSGGYKYHGRVRKLSEGARKGGLDF